MDGRVKGIFLWLSRPLLQLAAGDAHTSVTMLNKASWPLWDHEHHDFKEHAIMLKLSMQTMLKMIDEDQRPGKQEVVAALRAATVFAERAIEEPKIQTVLDEVRKLAIDSSTRDHDMEEKITHIKHQAASLGSSPAVSYASILGRSSNAPSTTAGVPIMPPAMPKQGQTPYNKLNEIIVKLQDETANKALEGKTPSEMTALVNNFIKSTEPTRKPIRAARRLGSGDICIMAANEEEAIALREHKEWMSKLSSNARAVTKTFGLLLHGVRIDAIDTKDMATAIKTVQNENVNTLNLDIVWIGWFGTNKEGYDKGSLIIELASPEEGNKALEEGLVIGSELHGCCIYNKQCRSKQCFVCWKYGHLSTACPKKDQSVCGKCSGEHHHKECTTGTLKCPVCDGRHEAWNKVCIAKKKEIARMRMARQWTPTRFVTAKESPASYQTSNLSSHNYFQNVTNQLRDERMFPKLSPTRGGPTGRGRLQSRGGFKTPDLGRTTTPSFQPGGRRNAPASPTRISPRNRSPSKAINEAKRYEDGIAAGEINDPETDRQPLSQRNSNERIAVPVNGNKKRQIRSVEDQEKENENTQEGEETNMDWSQDSSTHNQRQDSWL